MVICLHKDGNCATLGMTLQPLREYYYDKSQAIPLSPRYILLVSINVFSRGISHYVVLHEYNTHNLLFLFKLITQNINAKSLCVVILICNIYFLAVEIFQIP